MLCWGWSRRGDASLGGFALRKKALQRTQPSRKTVLVDGAESVVSFLTQNLHACSFSLRNVVDLDRIDDSREGEDDQSGVLFFVLVHGQLLGP